MKYYFLFALLFSPCIISAQDSYLLTNAGEKIEIRKQEYYYATFEKVRYYDESFWQQSMKLEDVKEIVSGQRIYRPYILEDKTPALYQILAVTPTRTLLVKFIEPSGDISSNRFGGNLSSIYYYIIDENNTVLASQKLNRAFKKKQKEEKETKAIADIKEHFANCSEIIDGLLLNDEQIMNFPMEVRLSLQLKVCYCN